MEKLEKHGIIRPLTSAWAVEYVTFREEDGMVAFCQDHCPFNALMKTDSGGLGSISDNF